MLRRKAEEGDDLPTAESGGGRLEALYRSELGRLTSHLRRRIGNAEDAADLAHDAFVRFARAAPDIIIKPEAYLRRIANNLLQDRAAGGPNRLGRLQVPIEAGLDAIEEFDQHRDLVAREELEHYRATLLRLKPKTLTIFVLHRVEGLSYRAIGERLGMSEGGVKRHMVKAIRHVAAARSRRR